MRGAPWVQFRILIGDRVRIHPARNPTEDLSFEGTDPMRIRADPVGSVEKRRHRNTLGIPRSGGADPMRIRWDLRWRKQVLGFPHVERAGPLRIRADPQRLTARNHGRAPSFQRIRCGSGGGLLNRTARVHRSCVSWGQTTRPYVAECMVVAMPNAWL